MLRLYSYFRSSAAYRVRIALHLKGLAFQTIPVHLLRDGGEQLSAEFSSRNPAQLVPMLETDTVLLTQSLAIIEYLEETYPHPPLLPRESAARARVRALAQAIACDIHPLNNLRVQRYLKSPLGVDEQQRAAWTRHWIELGFTAIERRLASEQAEQRHAYCHGDAPTLADCCLVPQVFNALRNDCSLQPFPTIRGIYERCNALEAFQRAAPAAQPDTE